jgi:hypothetical protein
VALVSAEKGDAQKNMESMEMLARGEKGEPGTRGEQGARGLSRRVSLAIVVLFAINALGVGFNLFSTAHEIGTNNRKFCQVISDVVPVPRPADPAANPSRETSYVQYERAVRLGRSLGC